MAAETGVSCDAYFPLGDVHFCESHLSEVTGWGTQTTDTNTAVLFFEGWCVEIREARVGLGGGCRLQGPRIVFAELGEPQGLFESSASR